MITKYKYNTWLQIITLHTRDCHEHSGQYPEIWPLSHWQVTLDKVMAADALAPGVLRSSTAMLQQ